ncbi:MAG TPA: 5'-3' exonuclease H3TH domain-containing protein [Solirubrobacteraceae bacterium]
MSGPLLAVDGPFILYRSFHALPKSIADAEGRPVNALLGATNLLLRVVADRAPRAVIVCFGAEAAAYRVELYPGYHADRPPPPEALARQFDVAPELFAAFGWASESSEALEADDVMHSLAQVEERAGGRALIMTGDRDLYQSATDGVTVLYLRMGGRGVEDVDPTEVERRYGVPPALVPDFIALRGDPSDGLPGAPGIGAKTAADLLRRHGSLEAAIDAAAGERPRVAAALRDHAAELRGFLDIARLRAVEVDRPADRTTDLVSGAEGARRHGMRKLAERLASGDDG